MCRVLNVIVSRSRRVQADASTPMAVDTAGEDADLPPHLLRANRGKGGSKAGKAMPPPPPPPPPLADAEARPK